MEKQGVYDCMRFTLILMFLYFGVRAQDSVSTNAAKDSLIFEYRFKINSMNDRHSVNCLEGELIEIFKTPLKFYQEISQYIFCSNLSVERFKLEEIIKRYEMTLEYYRQTSLIKK